MTLVADGAGGVISSQLRRLARLDEERRALQFSAGVVESWCLPEARLTPGRCWRASDWPLPKAVDGTLLVQELSADRLGLTLVASLAGAGAGVSLPALLARARTHPLLAEMLENGRLERCAAGLLPDGGYWSVPKLAADGALLLGAAAGLVNPARVAGAHLAMESGLAAARSVAEAFEDGDFSAPRLMSYDRRVRDGEPGQELFAVREIRPGARSGPFAFLSRRASRGRSVDETAQRREFAAIGQHPEELPRACFEELPPRSFLIEQPGNLLVLDEELCRVRCPREFGRPCERFCPAGVFHFDVAEESAGRPLLEPARCVHCMICTVADPYRIVVWAPPEGGDGPDYLARQAQIERTD